MNTLDSTNVSRRATNVMGADASKNSKVSLYIIFLLWMVEKVTLQKETMCSGWLPTVHVLGYFYVWSPVVKVVGYSSAYVYFKSQILIGQFKSHLIKKHYTDKYVL